MVYHLRAQKWKKKNWSGFRASLDLELQAWISSLSEEDKEILIIVGPSGGYCLKTETLKKFKAILLVDKDPLAAFFFRREHPGLEIHFRNEDIFPGLLNLAQTERKASWLWSNILGQLGLNIKEAQVEATLERVNTVMQFSNWFSFHDLYSFNKKNPNVMVDHLTNGRLKLKHKTTHTWDLDCSKQHVIESGYVIRLSPEP